VGAYGRTQSVKKSNSSWGGTNPYLSFSRPLLYPVSTELSRLNLIGREKKMILAFIFTLNCGRKLNGGLWVVLAKSL